MPNPPVEIIEVVERGLQGIPGEQGDAGTDAHVTPENVALAGAFIKTADTLDDIVDGDTYKKITAAELDAALSASQLQGIPYPVGDQTTDQTVGTGKLTFRAPYGFLLQAVRLSLATAPVGAAFIVDMKMNGTSLFATKPQIDDGKKTSKTSAVLPVFTNTALLNDAEITIDISQVGSSTAGAGLIVTLIGSPKFDDLNELVPAFTDSFSDAVGRMNQLYLFDFGLTKVADGINDPITNFAELAEYWNPNSTNAGDIVINKEVQRYVPMPTDPSTDQNFVFADDALELRVTIDEATGETTLRMNPTANVTKSRTIPLADTSQIKIGQVVGFGHVENEPNHARLRTYVMDGTITSGDVFSQSFRTKDDVVPLFTLSVTANASSTYASLAQAMVDLINAHPTLVAYNVQAYVMPECAGGYVVAYPKRSRSDIGAPNFGSIAKDSLYYWDQAATSVVGTVQGVNATIGNPVAGGSNVGTISWAKAVAGAGVISRTVTITCTTAGASGTAKVSIAATGTNAPFTTLTNQTVTSGSNLTLPDGARITPTIGTSLALGDVWTVVLTPPVTHQARQEMFANYVVEKGANFIKVAMPVTLTTASQVTISPSRFLHVRDNAFLSNNIPIGVGNEAGITVGQTASFSYQDSNLRIITGVSSGNITIEANVYAYKGLIMHISPVNMATSSADTTASNVLTFAAVPAGVKVGMVAAAYFSSPYSTGIVTVTEVTATTVTLSVSGTWPSGTRWAFHPIVKSAQIWSKFFMVQPLDNRAVMAMELECDVPGAWDIGAWPAFWCYSDTTGPVTGVQTNTSEVDFIDYFNYFNNGSTGNYNAAGGGFHTGTMQAGSTSTTAVLGVGSSDQDDAYNGMNVVTTGGTGNGQTRLVTDYDGATRTATISTAWTTTPDNTTTYSMGIVTQYLGPDATAAGASGNNLGTFPRKVGCIMTLNRLYFYIDGLLMVCKAAHWNERHRAQFAANLAMGSISTSFISNGLYPVDNSVFPCKFRLKKMKFFAAPNSVKPL